MPKLVVDIELGIANDIPPIILEIDGSETEDELEKMAEDAFFNLCNYGWHVED